jgi:hypothetical protein
MRRTAVIAAVLGLFVLGLLIGALVRTRTVRDTTTVYATTTTGVPVGCRDAIALTRRLLNNTRPSRIPSLTAQFDSAAGRLQLGPSGVDAFSARRGLAARVCGDFVDDPAVCVQDRHEDVIRRLDSRTQTRGRAGSPGREQSAGGDRGRPVDVDEPKQGAASAVHKAYLLDRDARVRLIRMAERHDLRDAQGECFHR